MPLSHLGLTVSHIPSATSFYLAALQPLGYRYIGHQGDSIGLGINEADFFLCQEQNGTRVSPTHLAFSADSQRAVRDCYANALNAGGHQSGSPGYRNDSCSCFNAAVEDLDGNTIEFIYRDPCTSEAQDHSVAPSGQSDVISWRDGVQNSVANGDVKSLASQASRARSRAQTALDLASNVSKSTKRSDAPPPGINRSKTEPVSARGNDGSKTLVGTLVGAAAGAALVYAMCSTEGDNAREEAQFNSAPRSKAPSTREAGPRSNYEKSTISRNPRAESVRSSHHPSRSMRALEAAPYDDEDVQDVISRYNSSRPGLPRSRTYDALEYVPKSTTSGKSDRFSMKRASTLPQDVDHYYLEGPRTAPGSRFSSRRGSLEDSRLKRHDSGVSMQSGRSRRSVDGGRRSSFSASTTNSKQSRRGSLYESAAKVPLPSSKATSRAPSYISAAEMALPQSKATSKAPSYISAAEMALPQSKATSKAPSYISAAEMALPQSKATSRAPSYISAAEMALPPSRATTSYTSAARVPIPPSQTNGGYTDLPYDSDGMGDMKTVVPEDSISCVDFYTPKKTKSKSGASKSSRHSSRSEAHSESTVRPAKPITGSKHSAQTQPLPIRSTKEEYYSKKSSGKRSTYTHV